MAEPVTPLLDEHALQAVQSYSPPQDVNLPNIPYRGFDTSLLPSEGGKPTPSALSALENKLFSISNNGDGKLTGGSIPRSLAEVSSDRYDQYVPGDYNNEDAYALGQGWPSKMVNGVGKGLALTATTFLQSTAGMVNGIAKAASDGRAASFYDNEFNRNLDEFNKQLENTLPNYYTDGEKQANWYSPKKLLTANFLWDGIIKNMGFAAGAYLSGGVYATGLKSLSALPGMSKLFSVGKAAETLAATEEALMSADKAASTYGQIESLSNKFLNTYNVLNKGQRVLVAGLATTGEAGFEAYYNLNDFRDRKIQEYKDTHDGWGPIGADLDAINEASDGVGNSSFLLNTALLTATNYIQFPKILGSSDKAERSLIASTTTKEIGEVTKNELGQFVKQEAKTRGGRILSSINGIRPYLFSTSEGFEEGAQYAISQGVDDYYNKKYHNQNTDWLESVFTGINKTIGTNEGMENILIGGLSGALMLGRGKFQESSQIKQNTADAIAKFNGFQLSDFTKSTVDAVNRGTVLQQERESSLRRGDVLEAKDKEQDYIINYLSPRIKYGRFDLVQNDINEYRHLASTDEGFSQLQADGKVLQGDTRLAYLQRLSNLEEVSKHVKGLYESLQIRYGNLTKDGKPVYSPEVIDKMVYASAKVADYDKRSVALSTKLALKGILADEVITDLLKGKSEKYNEAFSRIENLNEVTGWDRANDDEKEELLRDLNDLSEMALRRQLYLKEYNDIKKNPSSYKSSFEELTNPNATVDQQVLKEGNEKKTTIQKELEIGKEYPLVQSLRREANTLQLSPKLTILSRTVGGKYQVKLPDGSISYLTPDQFKQYEIGDKDNNIPEYESLLDKSIDNVLSTEKYKDLRSPEKNKLQYVNSLDNKELIDDVEVEFKKQSEELVKQKIKEEKTLKNKSLQKQILGSADPGLQTVNSESSYEPKARKSDITIVTSTKTAGKSILPHHVRANKFGANLDKFENRQDIKGVLITSKNEEKLGLKGLTTFLKGTSDADASKIVVVVMVENGKPVGEDGKVLESPSTDNIIVQVMPDPKLEWSEEFGGGTMFRKETTPEQIEYYKKQYTEWINKTLKSTSLKEHPISASFGVPEYVTYIDEKGEYKRNFKAKTSVEEAGLIESYILVEKPVIFIPTTDTTVEKGSVSFTSPLGRPFLNLPNGYVKLDNRKLTEKEAATIYEATHQLAIDIFENQDVQSEKSKRLINWLKSVIYWGSPKNKAGFNSIWFSTIDGQLSLSISGQDKTYPFTPSSIEANKEEIITLLEGMYNNINSGLTDKPNLWNAPYEQILSISPEGVIEGKQWQNYQTYLLSKEGRKAEELPLSTNMKPIGEEGVNRHGIYFTLTDTVDNYENVPKKAITPKTPRKNIFGEQTSVPSKEAPKRSIFDKPAPKEGERKPAIITSGPIGDRMEFSVDDIDEETVLRVVKEEPLKYFNPENWEETAKWLKSNFPNVPVYRVKNVIQATNGQQAWGMFKNGAIYVYENAEVGTIYHEVFEAVWKMFSDKQEQSDVLNEFKNRTGSFVDRPTGKTIEYSGATDLQAKEQLAEEFRDFVINKKVPQKAKEGKHFIIKLFNDLVDFIKSFFSGDKAKSNTEKLFDKIGRGYYKQVIPHQQQLSFANSGFIDIEQAYADNFSEFRIENIPADVVNDIMQHMTYLTLTDLIKDNKSLFSIPKIGKEELYNKLKTRFTKIAEQSGEWDNLVKKHQEYLKSYSIEFDESDDIILKDEDASKKGDYQEANKIDVFKKANSAVKLLLSTIPMVDEDGKLIRSSIQGVKLLPTSQVFMSLMNTLHTSRSIDEMMDRVKDMSEEDNNYKTLYNRLTKNTSDLSEISEVHDGQLLAAFWRTFKKQSPDVKNVYIFENGDVEVGDSNLSSAARQISADYGNEIVKVVKSKNPYFEYSNKEKAYIGKPSGAKSISLATDQNRIKFLNSLGIEFKISELSKLSSDKIDSFRTAVAGIKTSIEKAEKIVTVSRKVLDIKGRLMQLSLIRASIDNPEFDSTFFNVKGERTQTFIGTNPVSDLFDVLSQIKNKRQLVNTPYEYLLTDSFSQGSVILDKIFNPITGNRIKGGEQLMHPGYADGTVNAENGKKKQSAKLTYKERLTQELNLNLKGYYYNLVPGDASMEWMVYMGNHISTTTLLSGFSEIHKVFKGYFLSELELSREDRPTVKKKDSEDLRFLKSILGTDLQNTILKEKGTPEEVYEKYASQINKAVEAFIKQETINLRELLSKYDIIKLEEDKWITDNLSFAEGELSTDALNRQLNALTINYVINNIELHKLIYSDPYQYADELKRIKNANSPRQAIINNSPNFNKALNKMWNKGYDKKDIGYTDMTRDYFRTITSEDVVSTSDLKDYGNFEETDGGGIISQKAYRWFRIKAGEWNDDEEKQFRYDMAFEKDKKGLPLSWEEQSSLNGENPEVKSAYTPLKPIVFGNKLSNKNYNDIVLDKDALYPLSYRIAYSLNPESNAIKHYNKMQSEDIDYSVFHSGRKVGSEGLNPVYNEDGSFNNNPYEAIINISHGIISIQSEVPSKDESVVTRGSQITKLVTMDFMEAGVPIDYNKGGDYAKRFDEWNKLTESQKLSKSPLYKEIKNNQTLLEAITDQGYSSLLTRMGIEQTKDGNFVIKDLTKIAKTLKDEILKREVNDNIIDAFEGFKEGDVVLEATPAYQQIRNVLYSIADKNVISPKISGGQKVQIPSTLLESVRAKKEKGAYTSDVLRFYEDKDGKRTCEIMVGKWFKSPLSDEELLNYLNNTKEGQSILSGVAYRIPTQKQNSIDSFVIKQFLPREFGDSVIIPSALVKKVGSDFDIDKLFIYFKNTFTNLKENIKEIPFLGYGKEAKDKFAALYEEGEFLNKEQRNRLNKWIKAKQEDEAKDVVAKLATDIFGEDAFDQEVIDDFLESNSNEEVKNKIVEQMYKKSLENQYIQSLQNLISHPENFENLIKPNSAEQLKSLAKDVTKKLGFEEFSYDDPKNMLNRHFMSRLRHAFVSGKYAIGIAAVNQTNHSLNQRQPIYIDQERWDLLEAEDRFWLSGGTMNKEDVGIKFKNYNKIKIGEKEYPTLSMIKNSKGENISDIIGQFIDGYVDISKGPWIMELGASPNVASTWMFLVKLGVPIQEVAYFMNQPIIKDYLDSIENAGYVWLFIDDFAKEIKASDKYKASPSEFKKIKEIPSNLGELVGKEKLSPQEKAQQQFILNEFLKYAKMANHMFLVTQGANWDTANFNDSTLVFKKNEQLKKAQSTIISSVNDLIKNSFIGKLSERIYDVRDAFSTILTSDSPNVRDVIEDVLRPYVDMNDRDFVKLAQKVKNDLFDWAIQNDTRLNTQIHNILLSDENTAKQMSDFVIKVRKDDKHPLHSNQVVNLLTPHFSEKNQGVNNLKIKNKDNKVYDQNQMIYAFAELKTFLNGIQSPLYGSLVRLAVLQSGLSNSPISFTSLLPYKDFKEIYNKTLSTLETFPNLAAFKELDVFQRNNWNNDDLVPQRRAKKSKSGKYNTNMKFFGYKRVSKAIQEGKIPQLVKISNKAGISDSDVILYTWSTGTFAEQKEMKKKGDYSYIKKGLFKKVKQYDLPYEISYTIKDENDTNTLLTDYVYKAINAWGDSHSSDGIYFGANEFYNVAKPSVIDNGFIKVENETDDATILSYFESPIPSVEGEDDSNSNLPNCS